MVHPAALGLFALAIVAWGACTPDRSPSADLSAPATDPREAALVLLQAAQTGRTSRGELAEMVSGDLSAERWGALGDALAPLRETTRARILALEEIGPERTAVDLEVALVGEGSARYRVQAVREADGTWRVASLDGPGVAWPAANAARDEGLSTSAPPPPAAR